MFAARFRLWLGLTGMVAVVAALRFGATAQALTVNLSPAWDDAGQPIMSGLGAAPDDPANTFWNTEPIRASVHGPNDGTPRTQPNLLASDGSPTSIGWTLTGFWNDLQHINPHPDIDLFYTAYWNVWRDDLPGQIEVFGLNDAVSYDVYIYSLIHDEGGLYGGTFTIDNTTLTPDGDPWNHSSFVEGDNYVKFSNVVPSNGSIIVDIAEYQAPGVNLPAWVLNGWQIQTSGPPLPEATVFTWNQDSLGDWAVQGNWSFSGTPPSGDRANNRDHTAIFGDLISGPTIVGTHAPVTVNRIEFDNADNSYVIAGLGSVNLEANSEGGLPSVAVMQGTHEFQARVNLVSNTTADIASSSTLVFNNALDLMGNTLTKSGAGEIAIRNDLITAGGTVIVQQGIVSGNGTVSGDVNNAGGTISPGNSPGLFQIDGDYLQGADGTLLIEIAGAKAGVDHDRFEVSGTAGLAGTLEIELLEGFDPAIGTSFDILDFGELTGAFDNIILPDLAVGLDWETSSLYANGSLSVVPEPSTAVLMLMGILFVVTPFVRRRFPQGLWSASG